MWFLKTTDRFHAPALLRRIRNHPILCISLCLGLVPSFPLGLDAQLLQGTLNGNVADSTQAAMANATVVATDQATGFSRRTTTDASGFYTLSGLPPGIYN